MQCCPLSRGELPGRQQEPHAVHGTFLQLCHALSPAEERTGSRGSGQCHAKPKHYTKKLGTSLTERGCYEFWYTLCSDHDAALYVPTQWALVKTGALLSFQFLIFASWVRAGLLLSRLGALTLDTWACSGSMLGEATQSRQASLCDLTPSLSATSNSIKLGIPTQARTLICPAPQCPAPSASFELGIPA